MRISVIGRTHILLKAAQQCADAGHHIVSITTTAAAPEYVADVDCYADFARLHNAVFLDSPDINSDAFRKVLTESASDIAISCNWPTLIRAATCKALRYGILNSHAGDLPRYRGNACPNWAILNGESSIALCIHQMDPDALDAGPIHLRQYFPLSDNVYIGDFYAWLDTVLPEMFVRTLQLIETPTHEPEYQDRRGVIPLRCYPRRPDDGLIDWSLPADAIARLIRASSRPFSGAFSFLEGKERVTIWRAQPRKLEGQILAVPGQICGRGTSGGVLVACGAGILEILSSDLQSGSNLPAASRYRLMSPKGG